MCLGVYHSVQILKVYPTPGYIILFCTHLCSTWSYNMLELPISMSMQKTNTEDFSANLGSYNIWRYNRFLPQGVSYMSFHFHLAFQLDQPLDRTLSHYHAANGQEKTRLSSSVTGSTALRQLLHCALSAHWGRINIFVNLMDEHDKRS